MKKIILLLIVIAANCGCLFTHYSEDIIGTNDDGMTVIKFCKSKGTLVHKSIFGSTCTIELRDYGNINYCENNNEEESTEETK